MSSKTYAELLKDPRWQQRRLEVFERENFTCEWCGSTEKTLTVHHDYYQYGLKPWDYPPETVHCLCEKCHAEIGAWQKIIKEEIRHIGMSALPQVAGYLKVLNDDWNDIEENLHLTTYEHTQGIADYYQLNVDFLFRSLDANQNISTQTLHRLGLAARRKRAKE